MANTKGWGLGPRRSRQWRAGLGWWQFIATAGQVSGLGFTYNGRYNGLSIFFGPICFDIVPPPPKAMREHLQQSKP